jgi:hypothetical protein
VVRSGGDQDGLHQGTLADEQLVGTLDDQRARFRNGFPCTPMSSVGGLGAYSLPPLCPERDPAGYYAARPKSDSLAELSVSSVTLGFAPRAYARLRAVGG